MKKIALTFALSLALTMPAVLLLAGGGASPAPAASGEDVEAAVRHAEQELAKARLRG